MKFYNSVNLQDAPAKNLVIDPLSTDPSSPALGEFWFNTTSDYPKVQLASRIMTLTDQYVASVGASGIVASSGGLTPSISLTSSATSGQALLSAGTGSAPAFGAVNLAGGSSIVTGTLPVGNLPSIPNTSLVNSSITVGSTAIALGAAATTLAGLTSVTSTTFVGALTGNASTATTATNVAGGAAGSIPYQTGSGATSLLATGSGVLVGGTTPSWSTTPALTGTNFTGIPNAGLTNSSVTIGSTAVALGATVTTFAGLTSVTSTTFVGALTGNASSATNVAGGAANRLVYQTGVGATNFVTSANYGVVTTGATGTPAVTAGAAGVLVGSASAIPTWSTTPTLTGTNFTGIPNAGLTNSSVTIGSTAVALGATVTTFAGLTSVTSTTFVGALTGNASTATSATTATNVAGGAAGSIPYQTGAGATSLLATGSGVLVGGTTPSWSTAPTLTGTNFSGTATSLNIGGNAATVTTIPTLSGEVTNSGNAVTLSTSAVTGKLLTSYALGTSTAIAATDSILGAFGKVQAQINSVTGGLIYQGVWNATTNTSPALANGVGTKGYYYKVGTAGNTTIDGNTNWTAGDLIVFNGTTWDKVEGGSPDVVSVLGRVGTVTAQSGDYAVAQVTGAAPLASPTFTGTPAAPTPLTADSSTTIATTAFVKAQSYLTGNQTVTLSGDVSGSGTTAITATLANVVTAGTNTKITYNAKGLVTGGAALASTDIPNLDFAKITTGTVPVTQGGTGATTAAAARTNLGAVGKATGLIGDGTTTAINFAHNLALAVPQACFISVCIAATGEVIMPDITIVDANNVTLTYGAGLQPTTNAHRVTVIG